MKSIKKTIIIFVMIMIALSIVPAVYATEDNNTGGVDIASLQKNETKTNVNWENVPAPATNSFDPAQEAILSQDNGTASIGPFAINATTIPENSNTIPPSVSKRTYTIVPSAGPKGKISPSKQQKVPAGESITFNLIPDAGFTMADVIVDGTSVGAVSTYTFAQVTSDHTLSATFKKAVVENQKLTSGFFKYFSGSGLVVPVTTTTFYWDGKGHVYLTGGNGFLNALADDAFDVYTDDGFLTFFRSDVRIYEGIPDITSICHPGVNNLTLKIRDIYAIRIGCNETWLYFDQRLSANFTGTPTTATVPLIVNFTDKSTGIPTSWKWDFGDGKTSKQQNPLHKYTAAGTYTVSLTAKDADGSDTVTKAGYVVVTSGNPKLIIEARDFNTLELIPNATIRLKDYLHSGIQTVMAPNNGSVVFEYSGKNPKYPLIIGETYSINVLAGSEYNSSTRNITFLQNEQKEIFKLTKVPPPPPPVSNTFSITYVELYPNNRNLAPFGTSAVSQLIYKLNRTAGWPISFKKKDLDVTKEDLGIQGGGLNDATFHYHFSHGGRLLKGGNTLLELSNGVYVHPLEVQNKWGKNNKWVMIDACDILDDPTWGGALDTSHGIFGYKNEVGAKSGSYMVTDFFDNAFQKKTLLDSYRNATKYAVQYSDFKKVTAYAIFHNKQQAFGDHLPGYGTVEPDGSPGETPWVTGLPC